MSKHLRALLTGAVLAVLLALVFVAVVSVVISNSDKTVAKNAIMETQTILESMLSLTRFEPIVVVTLTYTPSLDLKAATPTKTFLPEQAAQATAHARFTEDAQTQSPTRTAVSVQATRIAEIATATAYQATVDAYLNAILQTATATLWTKTPIHTPSYTATHTPTSSFTATHTSTLTLTSTITRTFTSTSTASATATLKPTTSTNPTISTRPEVVVKVSSANLRSGPSTAFPVVASASQGTILPVVASTTNGEGIWYLVDRGNESYAWISERVVDVLSAAIVPTAITAPAPPAILIGNALVVSQGYGAVPAIPPSLYTAIIQVSISVPNIYAGRTLYAGISEFYAGNERFLGNYTPVALGIGENVANIGFACPVGAAGRELTRAVIIAYNGNGGGVISSSSKAISVRCP